MYLFFDTETTGLPDFKLPLDDPSQPRVIELGLLLTNAAGKEMASFNALITPDGWEIDEEGKAFETHRISNAECRQYGVQMKTALGMFRKFQDCADLKIAFGYRFDGFLLKCEHERLGIDPGPVIDKYCAMTALVDIMNLPPTPKMVAAGMNKPKTPNLAEAYKFCTGFEMEGAHRAINDCRALKEVFFWILQNGHYVPQERKGPPAGKAA